MTELPESLYDPKDSLRRGGIARACGYLMRLRGEYLLEQPDGALGLRRALHAFMLAEIVHNTYETMSDAPRSDKLFGYFNRELGWKVLERLVASKATLSADELRFADITWWKNLDMKRSRVELLSNLERMFHGDESLCLLAGVEMHILLDSLMTHLHPSTYESIREQGPALTMRPLFMGADVRVGKALRPEIFA